MRSLIETQKWADASGSVNPTLYALPKDFEGFGDVTQGDNRVSYGGHSKVGFDAQTGWDPAQVWLADGEELAKVFDSDGFIAGNI